MEEEWVGLKMGGRLAWLGLGRKRVVGCGVGVGLLRFFSLYLFYGGYISNVMWLVLLRGGGIVFG
jgi:hypothetical protein